MKKSNFDTIYNRHIRKARAHAKHSSGIERASLIADYFAMKTDHPHVQYTYESEMMNLCSEYQFPIDLMQTMASLCAENEMLELENE